MQLVNIHTHRPTGSHIEPAFFGIHPWSADGDFGMLAADRFADVEAVGETGLDFACNTPRKRQEELFRAHLKIAAEIGKPVILHCVRAFEPMMKILEEYPLRAVIFHGFTGSRQQAERAVARDYMLSFGDRTFRSPRAVGALQFTPLRNLFLETDDSDTQIETVYQSAAEVKSLTLNELQEAIIDNYKRIFNRK